MAKQRVKFSDQLRQAIVDSDIRPSEICKRTGIDKGALSHYLAGHRGMSLESIDRVVALLDLELVSRRKRSKKR